MRSKWYTSTFIILLIAFGAVFQQQTALPNQEIVLQFNDVEITSNEAQNTIATVKQQLLELGVDNIQVIDKEDGRLKIIYYSDADVASIKEVLSNEKSLNLHDTSQIPFQDQHRFPFQDHTFSYDLDVFEIVNGSDTLSDQEGTFVLELKPNNDRFFNPNVFSSKDELDEQERNRIVKVSYKVRRNIAIAIDNTSHNIPEVRAGPSV